MNKIYKVIWSKAKHTYVVASEIAKGHTKGETTGKGLKKLAAAMLVAAALLSPSFAWAEDTTVKVDKSTSAAAVEVYTKEGANSTFATQDQLQKDVAATNLELANKADVKDVYSKTATDNMLAAKAAVKDVYSKTATDNMLVAKADVEDVYSKTATDNMLAAKADVEDVYSKMATDNMLAEKANTADVYSKTDADAKFATQEQLQKDVSATNLELTKERSERTAEDEKLDSRITAVKEFLQTETENRYVSKDSLASELEVKAAGVVKEDQTIGENVSALGKALYDETNARIWADKSQDKRIDDAAAGIASVNNALATQVDNLNQQDANEAATRAAADTELNERITNEANAIHDEIKAGDTALDTRITNVKEYLEKQTSDKYISKDDAAVQDGAIVKAANTIGDNVTKLDAALAKETADRIGADAAQNKVIQTVNDNLVSSVNTINKNMADGFKALSTADANELAGRVAADTKLAEAVNGGLSLSDNNVLQKNTTKVNSDGTVSTSKEPATTLIMNEGKGNQITLSENGIKVGTNSSVVDKDGVYTGGDNYAAAKAAMSADGKIKGANGAFTVDENGNVTSKATITGETVTDGKGASMSNGTVTGKTLTDGIATISNGNINTTGTVTGGTVTSTGNISALGDIHAGGAITGGSASIQGALTAGSATITGNLTAGGDIQGKSISDGTATMQNGNITGVKNLSAETITTSGNATIGGDLTVKGKLNVDEIDLTKNGIDGDYHVTSSTKVAAGEITSYKKATSTKDGSEKESAFDYDENGTSTWAQSTDADKNWNKSTLKVEGNDVTSKVVDSKGNTNESKQTATESKSTIENTANPGVTQKSYITQNLKKILQGIQNGSNESIVDQTETGIKSTATDGKNTASTNLSNGGFNTYATDGTNKTYTLQTAESLTSQIGDDGKVKSVMNADGITNNADGGTITNSAKDLVNTATGDITNTAKNGTITNDAKELVNTATGNMTNTVGGKLLNDVTGDMENKVGGNLTTTVTGDVKEDYKANLSTTVGGNQTTTVTGDSSLTAENINNEAKNKIINKALDVETDAKSSIVNKVANDAGSNTSTQLSYQTTEEMSQADGKTASYLRGAAEEKSQLTDGDKKTTIDTIAGQTNTNITDGTNTSNNLQKADQVASSVTDGTNSTVVDQKAGSIASSITDGTKINNTNNTVDKSEQLIKASDTQYSATTKTAAKMEDALVSGSSVIDVIKSLDDAANPVISSAVTDGTNTTGSTMTAKGITNSAAESIVNEIGDGSKVKSEMTAKGITNTAKDGTITNDAKDLVNNASENMTNTVGKDLTTTVGGEMKTTVTGKVTEDYKSDLDTKVGGNETHAVTGSQTVTVSKDRTVNVKGTETENFNAQVTNIKTDQRTSVGGNQTNIVAGNQQNTVSGSKTETVKGSVTEKYGSQATTVDGDQRTNVGGNQFNVVAGNQTNTISGSKTETVKGAVTETYGSQTTKVNGDQSTTVAGSQTNSITGDQVNTIGGTQTTTVTGDSSLSAKNISNTASETLSNSAKNITNTAETIKDVAGKTTVTTTDTGTTFENTDHSTAIKEGTITKTTISGNTLETGKATMDYADVMKDLGVHGNATIKGDTTMEGNASVGKDLTVAGTSTLTGDVTMKSNATVEKDLTVNGKSTLKGGLEVTNGTTTDKLKVTGSSEFGGAATFNDIVKMNKGLSVTGGVTADSYKVGDKTYIDKDGINANNQVIRNVGQGDISEGSHDAVSGGQLYETNTRVSGLETRMGTVETKVDKLDNKIDKVGANAAAMANLHPLEFDEDSKWNIAAAVGSSGSETASAVGVFYRPNENVMVNASAAMGTGENMFGGGVSLRLGHGGNKAKEAQMKAAAKENRELRAKVDDLTARMDALLSVLNPNMSKDFPDVPENHWAYEAVSRLAGNGIVEGYEDGKYHGERQMTRYEMAEIIYNALSKGAKAEKKLVEEFRPELQAMAAQKKA